jgi:carbamoyl-phosphate synthase large subunit
MPKRTDIHSVLIIGAGPIIIGQACEFDYSGTQACKALREEGYRVILVNSNPATIMTDPEFADRTYIEPVTPEAVEKIIVREQAEMKRLGATGKLVLLPTLGGQTALNTAMSLHRAGTLEKHGVRMIGAKPEAIEKGEDRLLFKNAMLKIGLDLPQSGVAHNMEEARTIAEQIGTLPLIIRPAYTLGGTGGGIAYNKEEFETITASGLDLSPVTEVLIEESLLGWKEFEMEVMREPRPHGRAHRRLDHRRADPDAHGSRIPNHARLLLRLHPRDRRGDRRIEHPVRRASRHGPHDRHRDESARQPQLRTRVKGHRLPHREDRRQARRRLHAR